MKTILITVVTIFFSNAIYATELSWVDEQIEAIKPPRKGINISDIGNPFIFLEKNGFQKKGLKKDSLKSYKKPSKISGIEQAACDTPSKENKINGLVLNTIINSSAMINGKWYKKSEKISGYSIVEVAKTSITLKKGDKQVILSTHVRKPNLKFKNK